MKKRHYLSLLNCLPLLAAGILLTGCGFTMATYRTKSSPDSPPPPGYQAATEARIGPSFAPAEPPTITSTGKLHGYTVAESYTIVDEARHGSVDGTIHRLGDSHIQIIMLGDTMRVIMPSEMLFGPHGVVIRRRAYPLLDDVVRLMRLLPQGSVTIRAYTDNVWQEERSLPLTERQARSIAAYLSAGGVSLHRISAKGMGGQSPVDSNTTSTGSAGNRRVELRMMGRGASRKYSWFVEQVKRWLQTPRTTKKPVYPNFKSDYTSAPVRNGYGANVPYPNFRSEPPLAQDQHNFEVHHSFK